MIRVVACDPGTSTGIVSYWGPRRVLGKDVAVRLIDRIEVDGGWKCGVRAVLGVIARFQPHVFVHEDFILTSFGSSEREGIDPVRLNAVFEWELAAEEDEIAGVDGGWMSVHGKRDLVGVGSDLVIVKYTAAHAKGIITDKRLKAWGLWYEGSTHIRDATRHLCLFLRDGK